MGRSFVSQHQKAAADKRGNAPIKAPNRRHSSEAGVFFVSYNRVESKEILGMILPFQEPGPSNAVMEK